MTLSSGVSRISRGRGANLLSGIFFAGNCMRMKKTMDWGGGYCFHYKIMGWNATNLRSVSSLPFPISLIIDWMQCSKKISCIFLVHGPKVLDNNFLTGADSKEAGYPIKGVNIMSKIRWTQTDQFIFTLVKH